MNCCCCGCCGCTWYMKFEKKYKKNTLQALFLLAVSIEQSKSMWLPSYSIICWYIWRKDVNRRVWCDESIDVVVLLKEFPDLCMCRRQKKQNKLETIQLRRETAKALTDDNGSICPPPRYGKITMALKFAAKLNGKTSETHVFPALVLYVAPCSLCSDSSSSSSQAILLPLQQLNVGTPLESVTRICDQS